MVLMLFTMMLHFVGGVEVVLMIVFVPRRERVVPVVSTIRILVVPIMRMGSAYHHTLVLVFHIRDV